MKNSKAVEHKLIEKMKDHGLCADPVDYLPFANADNKTGETNYWDVHHTGDIEADHIIGKFYAARLIDMLKETGISESLTFIFQSMPQRLGYVEEGFLEAICEYLAYDCLYITGNFKTKHENK